MVETVVKKVIEDESLKDTISRNFIENIEIQGGSFDSFVKIAKKTSFNLYNIYTLKIN